VRSAFHAILYFDFPGSVQNLRKEDVVSKQFAHRKLWVERLEERQMLTTIFSAPLDTDPGWTTSGQWAFGVPTGHGGIADGGQGNPDPCSGKYGPNVYGVNLNGNYDFHVTGGGPHYLTTTAIDCTNYRDVSLSFWRKLNTDRSADASATIDVSHDGTNWNLAYAYADSEQPLMDSEWTRVNYDISTYADNQPTVYIRWGYSLISAAYAYSGWNIDEVLLTGTTTSTPPTTSTWDGGGGEANKLWTTPENWVGEVAPAAGNDLLFPEGPSQTESVNNCGSSLHFRSITVSGNGYIFHGGVSSASVNVPAGTLSVNSIVADVLSVGKSSAAGNGATRSTAEEAGADVLPTSSPMVAIAASDLIDNIVLSIAVAKSPHFEADAVVRLANLPDFQSIIPADKVIDRTESRAFASVPNATPTGVQNDEPALDAWSEVSSRPILCVVDWQRQPDDAIAPSIVIALSEPTLTVRIENPMSGECAVRSDASLAAIESAVVEYRQRHFADPENFASLRQRHGGKLAKPFEIAADAVIAIDWRS
jgi:hypothetical protein